MFKSNEIWRHRSTTEIDFEIVKVTFNGPDYIKVKVRYLNRQVYLSQNILIDPKPQLVKILRKDFHNWSRVD